jgi:hypothetical protein
MNTNYCFLIIFRLVFIIKSCGAVPFYRSRQEREGLRGFIELKTGNTSFVLFCFIISTSFQVVGSSFRRPRLLNWLFLYYRLVILSRIKNKTKL